jgi:putative secretion ATPase (PEP-CTERM system associated)
MYESFYGLTGKPFQLNPDPAFFFGSRGHKRAFAYLQYGLYQSEGFIIITGEIGAGKTTIVRSLFEQLDTQKVVPAQLVSTHLDADDMLRAVGIAYGLPVRTVSKAVLLGSLEAFLCKLAMENKRALLIVDEAQNLTWRAVEELRMLSNYQLGDKALLQSFLIGQPELRTMMQSPQMQQLRQRVIASYHLGPIDRDETKAYIEHRLKHVGWKGDPEFEPGCFDVIHSLTAGIPRRINTLCSRLLLGGFLGERHYLTTADAQAIAKEIYDELGPDAILALEPVDEETSDGYQNQARGEAPDGYQSQIREEMPNGEQDSDKSDERLREWRMHFRHIEERIDRLDKTVGAAVNLLYGMLHPDKPVKPQSPVER